MKKVELFLSAGHKVSPIKLKDWSNLITGNDEIVQEFLIKII